MSRVLLEIARRNAVIAHELANNENGERAVAHALTSIAASLAYHTELNLSKRVSYHDTDQSGGGA